MHGVALEGLPVKVKHIVDSWHAKDRVQLTLFGFSWLELEVCDDDVGRFEV